MNNQKQFRLSVVLLVVVTISIVLFFGGSAKAATSDVLDQEQTSYSGNVWVNSDYPRYQTFTPFYSGQLSKIDICIFDSMSSPGALKVSIYKEGDLSTPLGSAQLASFGSGWASVDFSSILPYLTRETMYRMVVSTENGGSAGFGWFTSHNDAYLRGYAPAIGMDFTFKTYMIPDYALSPTESQVTINNISLVADGTSQTTVTIQLKDAQGNNITTGGEAVTIASSLGTVSAVTDHNNGTYTATLTAPTTIGTGSISASVGGSAIPTTASVQFVSGPPSLAKSTVTVNDNSLLADGTSQTTVTVKLKDAQGNDVTTGGATVSILSTLGTIGTVTNHNNGAYTATLTAPSTAGTSTISATVNGNAIAATTSVQFNPKPAQTVDATVASNTPTVGSDNMITLSVKNALGDIDTTFNGIKNVTIFGYNQAPNGSIGHLNGQPLTSSSQLVALGFTNGVATVSLKLNAATTQSIGFIVSGVSTATTNSLTITPVAGSAASMKVTTDLKAPTINGGIFSQQPVVTLYDAYENISVNDYTKVITVAKKDAGAWMLTGTLTAKANAGIVSFSDLGSVNAANVSSAQLSFDATGLGQITSSAVTLLPKPFTVSFDVNGGSPVIDLTISYGDKIIAPTAPTKTGYTFAGWYKSDTLTTQWDFLIDVVTKDTTLYAKWFVNSSSGSDGQSSTPTTPSVPENPETPSKEPSNPVETPQTEPSKPEIEQEIIFSDVPKTHWAWEMIQDMTRKGIITGYPDKTFRPNDYIKRQHIAVMFARAFELEPIRETVPFKDVLPSHPYYEAITKLYQAGIVDGSNGEFHPDAFLTRAQMAKVLVEALQLTPDGTSHFKDVPPTHWSYNYIATLQQEGIALGDDGYFKPNDPMTRAQFVALMSRAMNR